MGNRTSRSPPPLLGVDPGLEEKVLVFVSSGEGGIKDVLNLRLVCSTTKLWVDHLPKKQADVVFSRAHVHMNLHFETLHRFLASPPPFKVTSLSIAAEGDALDCIDSNDTWNKFCAYWKKNLQTLVVKAEDLISPAIKLRVLELMESPNLLEISLCPELILSEGSPLPSCFVGVRKLRAGAIFRGAQQKNQFYTQLQTNRNLRELRVSLVDVEDLVEVSNLINQRKYDTQLQLNFEMKQVPLFVSAFDTREQNARQAFENFANSIVASNSKIQLLDVFELDLLDKGMNELLPSDVCRHFLNTVESVIFWKPKRESSPLFEYSSRLKKILFVDTNDFSVQNDRLKLPPSLEELGLYKGFAPLAQLPPTLTILHLNANKFVAGTIRNLLNLIRIRCPSLKSLHIRNLRPTEAQNGGIVTHVENSAPFSRLKQFSFTGKVQDEEHAEEIRTALANEFDWPHLQLTYLHLHFKDSNASNLPLVGEEILSGLLTGHSAKSLRTLKVPNGCVTAGALPLLKKLESLPSVTVKGQDFIPEFFAERRLLQLH